MRVRPTTHFLVLARHSNCTHPSLQPLCQQPSSLTRLRTLNTNLRNLGNWISRVGYPTLLPLGYVRTLLACYCLHCQEGASPRWLTNNVVLQPWLSEQKLLWFLMLLDWITLRWWFNWFYHKGLEGSLLNLEIDIITEFGNLVDIVSSHLACGAPWIILSIGF